MRNISVVGRWLKNPVLGADKELDLGEWQLPWSVESGLTGPADTGHERTQYEEKLRYVVEYTRQ